MHNAEARSAELAHALPAESLTAVWPDVTLAELEEHGWFLNEWQANVRMSQQRFLRFSQRFFCWRLCCHLNCRPNLAKWRFDFRLSPQLQMNK